MTRVDDAKAKNEALGETLFLSFLFFDGGN
jgi:hypothetical protein